MKARNAVSVAGEAGESSIVNEIYGKRVTSKFAIAWTVESRASIRNLYQKITIPLDNLARHPKQLEHHKPWTAAAGD